MSQVVCTIKINIVMVYFGKQFTILRKLLLTHVLLMYLTQVSLILLEF